MPEKAQALFGTHNRLGIPALFIEEALHGYDTGTVFPTPLGLAATWDSDVAEQTASSIAAEARSNAVDMILAPVLDLARDPRWGRVEEDFGEDPYLTGRMGLAYVLGAQGSSLRSDHTVVAEPKYFAGHGSPEGGTNMSPVHIGECGLRSVMLKSFEPSFREGHAMATMAAYHEIDGVPVTADPLLLKKILRQEWGFQGFVLSDLGAIERLYKVHHVAATPKEAACMAKKGMATVVGFTPIRATTVYVVETVEDMQRATSDSDTPSTLRKFSVIKDAPIRWRNNELLLVPAMIYSRSVAAGEHVEVSLGERDAIVLLRPSGK
ncbi:MAG TPA: glycoside hydrolase family 3 N-terminal domain-containing protein [Edaphobacter sp.]|nr:glycoside hydrolase family 3 N-terminal domain-containing protein [Edaphobacter sp.]